MASIKVQIKRGRRIKNSFDNFKKTGASNMTKGACASRMEQLQTIWSEFEKDHDLLMESDEIDSNDDYFVSDYFSDIEEAFLHNLGLYKDHLIMMKDQSPGQSSSRTVDYSRSNINVSEETQLPPIKLPTFSGDIQDWTRFRDTFEEMVVNRPGATDISKMNRLHSALKGEAAQLIEEIPAAGKNFESAWTLVTNHYNNNRLLISNLISKLHSLEPMAAESASEVSRLHNSTRNILQALQVLGSPIQYWDHWIVFLTVGRLSPLCQRKWEETVAHSDNPQEPPTFASLEKFLQAERLSLLQLASNKGFNLVGNAPFRSAKPSQTRDCNSSRTKVAKSVNMVQTSPKPLSCPCCSEAHFSHSCPIFLSKSVSERKALVLQKKLCFNCLGRHFRNQCKSKFKCKVCSLKHHSLLHEDNAQASISAKDASEKFSVVPSEGSNSQAVCLAVPIVSENPSADPDFHKPVLLATAYVNVLAENGRNLVVRALIDQGSQLSFISEELCKLLKLQRKPARETFSGVGRKDSVVCKSVVAFTLTPHFVSTFRYEVTAYVLPQLTTYRPAVGKLTQYPHLQNLVLADPRFDQAGKVDLLLSARVHARIIEEGLSKGDEETPIAMKTLFGWIVSGPVQAQANQSCTIALCVQDAEPDFNVLLRRFWEIEEVPLVDNLLSPAEKQCEEFYKSTVKRKKDGRYVVKLPLKPDAPVSWPGSFSHAAKMLSNLHKRFAKNADLREAYVNSMRDFEKAGFMRRVSLSDAELDKCFFLPHHAVLKASSTTTKLRTVFNASARSDEGVSLNDFLLVGPNLLPDVSEVLTDWRRYPFVFDADTAKMYLQIGVHESDQHLQAIVWSEDESQDLILYFFDDSYFWLCLVIIHSYTHVTTAGS